jgi:hypothetical protein
LPSSQRRFLSINKWVTHTHTLKRGRKFERYKKNKKCSHILSPYPYNTKKKKTLDPISTLGPTNIKKKKKTNNTFWPPLLIVSLYYPYHLIPASLS